MRADTYIVFILYQAPIYFIYNKLNCSHQLYEVETIKIPIFK